MRRALLLFSVVVLLFSLAAPVFAAECPNTSMPKPQGNYGKFEVGGCARHYTGVTYQPHEFTSKLVACVQGTITQAVIGMMAVIAGEFGWVFGVLATLVLIFYGIRILSGERDILQRGATLCVKLAFVAVFLTMLPELVGWVFGVFQQMLMLVTGGYSPWARIDAFIGKLFGVGPSITLINGVIGLIGASIFSSTVGVTTTLFGVMAILNLLNFIWSLIFTYLLAFLTVGFLLMLMPIVIPLSLFFYTERYFRKWADIIVAAILTPVLIFAFVWMFVGIFDILIQNIFDILGGNDFRSFWKINTSLCSWLMPTDPSANALLQNLPKGQDVPCVSRTVRAAVQSNINPYTKNAFDACALRVATLDFGANDVGIQQRLSFALMQLWLFSSLMKSLVGLMPQIASSIASASTGISFGGGTLGGMADKGISKMKGGLQGAAGSQISKAVMNFKKEIGNVMSRRK